MPSRVCKGETTKDLFRDLSSPAYSNSCLIIHKIKQKQSFHYEEHLSEFSGSGIVVRDRKKRDVQHFKKYDFMDDGSIHGKCTLMNVLHLVHYLKYSRILFVGIDLYDSRYFWLRKTRPSIKKRGLNYKNKHPVRKFVIMAVRRFKKSFPKIEMYTHNPKSRLRKAIPAWEDNS